MLRLFKPKLKLKLKLDFSKSKMFFIIFCNFKTCESTEKIKK